MKVLVTGAAGFIGSHLTEALLARGHAVAGLDSMNAYYDPALKRARRARVRDIQGVRVAEADRARIGALEQAAAGEHYDTVVHLAAQAGVRYAVENPAAYTQSNLVGQQNVLEFMRRRLPDIHLIYASSSSVYGNDSTPPFSEDARAERPISYYGATKRAGELMAHSYAELYGLKATGLRFFTVYGPWGRPDMAYWLFTEAILRDEPIKVFSGGLLRRDFTWIGDVVDALVTMVETPFRMAGPDAPHRIYNLGNNRPEDVRSLVALIERATGRRARIEDADGPPGDVRETYADIARAARDYGFSPRTSLAEGIPRFVAWYRGYRGI